MNLIVSGDVSRRISKGVPGIDMDMHVLIHSGETKTVALPAPVMTTMPSEFAKSVCITAAEVRAQPEVARNLEQ